MIPRIDVGSLFGEDGLERRAADHVIHQAAAEIGFIQIHGLPGIRHAIRRVQRP